VLMVSTTVRMVDGVHSNTTSTRPDVTLGLEFVVRATGLEQGFIDTSTAGDNTDRRTRRSRDGLLCATWEADTGFVVIGVAYDGGVVAGCTGECATVSDFLLDVANNGTFWQLADGEDVANGELGLFAAVDEGTGVQAFGGDECLRAAFVSVRVAEDDASEGRATTGIMDDFFYDTPDISITFCKV